MGNSRQTSHILVSRCSQSVFLLVASFRKICRIINIVQLDRRGENEYQQANGEPKTLSPPPKRVKFDTADEITDDELEYSFVGEEYKQDDDDDVDFVDVEADEEEGAIPDLESEAIAAALGDDEDDSSDAGENEKDHRSDTVDLSSGE